MLNRPSLILLRWSCARGSASSGWRGCSWLAGLIGSRFLPRELPCIDLYCSLWSLYLSAVFHNKSTMKIWKKYSRAISQFVPKLCLPTTNPQDQHVLISDQPFNVEKLCRRCVEAQKHEDEVASSRSWTRLGMLWLWPGWWQLWLWWVSLLVSVSNKQEIIQFYYISAAVDDLSIFRKPLLQEIPETL